MHTMALAPEPGTGVLAVVLCLSFARSHLDHDVRGRLEAAIALPLVGLVTVGVGMLLLHERWLGASVFVLGMFAAVRLRQFGPATQRAGSLIALPLVVILTTPHVPRRHDGTLMAVVVPVAVALLALAWVMTAHALARWLGLMPPRQAAEIPSAAGSSKRSVAKPTPTTRLALLADAFDPATPAVSKAAIDALFAQLEDVAPAFRALRWASRRFQPAQPADWIDAVQACQAPAHRLIEAERTPVALRRALGVAREALREPPALTVALQDLQRTFDAACPTLVAPKTQVE